MMLSRLLLTHEDMLRLRLTDVYSVHRIVYDCFPADDATQLRGVSSNFLYADNGLRRGQREIVILSAQKPQQPRCGDMQTKPVPSQFLEYSAYRFLLTVNPVRRQSNSGKLTPLRKPEDVHAWFEGKSSIWGFSVAQGELRVDEVGVWQFNKKNHPVTLGFARLSGILHVTARNLFHKAFFKGIGRGKAFGCGLLQLAALA
jgi:CRISPR system Cascade subunit CasE